MISTAAHPEQSRVTELLHRQHKLYKWGVKYNSYKSAKEIPAHCILLLSNITRNDIRDGLI